MPVPVVQRVLPETTLRNAESLSTKEVNCIGYDGDSGGDGDYILRLVLLFCVLILLWL